MTRLRFRILGSGSRGNATVVAAGRTRLLLDCGFGLREAERRLAKAGLRAEELTAIVVTHEHGDHAAGVFRLAARHRLPVYLSTGTWQALGAPALAGLQLISPHESFAVDDLEIQPYPVPHDAREPCQFVFSDGNRRLGILSDTGTVTPHIRECLDGCDALVVEFNHCPQMLARGPYPPALQARVGGGLGHLSNPQSSGLLAGLERGGLQHLVAAHVSEKNNHPEQVRAALATALPAEAADMAIAEQDHGLDWREIT